MSGYRSIYEERCEMISKLRCPTCNKELKPVKGYDEESKSVGYSCSRCNYFIGLDDSFSEEEAVDFIELLQQRLQEGTVFAENCQGGCGNQNINDFVITEKDGCLALECKVCGFVKVFNEIKHDEQLACRDDDGQFLCDCGNNRRDGFSKETHEGLLVIKCHECHAEFATADDTSRFENRECADSRLVPADTARSGYQGRSPSCARKGYRYQETEEDFKMKLNVVKKCIISGAGRFCKSAVRNKVRFSATVVAMEAWNTAEDIIRARSMHKDGEISKAELSHQCKKRLVQAACRGVFCILGGFCGQIILPIVGQSIGCTLGNVLGDQIAKMLGPK